MMHSQKNIKLYKYKPKIIIYNIIYHIFRAVNNY